MKLKEILNSATMGEASRLRPMILWTILEYFLRGAPYGIALFIIWEIFTPLSDSTQDIDVTKIAFSCVGLLISLILLRIVARRSYLASFRDGYKICNDGRKAVTSHLCKLPMGFYNSKDPGEIAAYVISDYANIETMVTHLVPQFFGAISMPIVLIISLSLFSWKLALVAILIIPLAWPVVKLSTYLVHRSGLKQVKSNLEASSRMIEYIQGIKLVKAFNLGGEKFKRLESSFDRLKKDSIRLEACSGPSLILSSVLLSGGFILIIIFGFTMLLSTTISLPVYIMFLVFGTHIYQPLIHAMIFLAEISYSKIGVNRIENLRKAEYLKERKKVLVIQKHDIVFKNVDFAYQETKVLNGLNIEIPEKKLTALVGLSGSGKTTITRLIARFWDVNKGSICIGGIDIKNCSIDYLYSKISMVFQDVYLFNDTIYNNILIGNESATRKQVTEAAKLSQCHSFINDLELGYDTMVGEGGSTLSGGEKQRISIARAILKNSPIILLDEATASLDSENESLIQEAINSIIRNKTVVVIAHRLNTIQTADNIIVLDKGKLAEQGNHDYLLTQNGIYKNMWDEQQRIKSWKF